VLHGLAVAVSGHRPPLPIVGRSTLRVRDAVPPAHVAEQVSQLDQAPTMQSTACIEGEPDGTVVGGSVGVGVVELSVGNRVGEGVGAGVGDGVGAYVGVGVGLHAETVCSMMPASKSSIFVAGHVRTPLCQSQRRWVSVLVRCGPVCCSVSAQSWRRCELLIAQCIMCKDYDYVRVCMAGCRDLHVSNRACLRMRAHESTTGL
jgi:hypothetical protein